MKRNFFAKICTFMLISGAILISGFNLSCLKTEKIISSNESSQNEKDFEIPQSENYIIVVYKEAHKLHLIKSGKTIKIYPCNIRNELEDRQLEGDGQTPEGIFKIWQMAIVTNPAWTRWMAFDTKDIARKIFLKEYPAGKDILTRYEEKYGPLETDNDIREFNKRNKSTPMLRGFGIHGGGYYPGNDWTLGCPALEDKDIIELYDFIKTNPNGGIGTELIILD